MINVTSEVPADTANLNNWKEAKLLLISNKGEGGPSSNE